MRQPTHIPSRYPRAFTLVELLVVVAVIAVLVAMLLPSLHKARQQAKNVACASNQRQLVMGVLMYVSANKGWMPFQGNWGASLYTGALNRPDLNYVAEAQYTGLGLLYQYNFVKAPRVFWCASEDVPTLTAGSLSGSGISKLPLGNTACDTTYWYRFGWGMRYGGNTGNRWGPLCAKANTIRRPDDGVLMCGGWNGGGNEPNYIRASHLHLNQGFNLAFIDGHVTWMDFKYYPKFTNTAFPQNGQAVPAGRNDYKTNRYRADMPTDTINRATEVYHGAWRMPP